MRIGGRSREFDMSEARRLCSAQLQREIALATEKVLHSFKILITAALGHLRLPYLKSRQYT